MTDFRSAARQTQLRLRTATEEDQEFCFRLNEACFRSQIEMMRGWDEARERADAAAQFRPGADFIVLIGGRPVGHFAVEARTDCIELRMLALAPSIQGKGIGTSLLR